MTTTTFTLNRTTTSGTKTWVTKTAQTFWQAVKRHNQRRRAVEHLRSMTDQHLRDVGMQRHEIFTMVYGTNTEGVHRFSSTTA